MKIVNIILTSQNGGAEQVFIDYSLVLKNLGHDVLAIVKNDAPYVDKLSNLGINFKKIGNKLGDNDLFAVNKIKKILEEFDADAVFAHVGRSMVLVRKAIKKVKNKKVLLVAVNHSMNVKRSIGADLIISVNKEIFFRTIDLGQEEGKSIIIHNAIDVSDEVFEMPKINLTKDEIVIGVIGRVDKAKGFNYAIRAIKKLEQIAAEKNLKKKFILKISGTGERESKLRDLVKELNLEDKVEFLGWTHNKKEFFDQIDIFCLPSIRETFGLVVLEAIKYKKPIICNDADGPKEIIRNEIDGLLTKHEPLEEIPDRVAEAVIKMIENQDLAKQMIENSFARLQERFSYPALEKSLEEVVGKVS